MKAEQMKEIGLIQFVVCKCFQFGPCQQLTLCHTVLTSNDHKKEAF